ncbi:adenylyl-sulfate kinase [Nocardioides sp. DS6]|uniref:Adenylyl-sulfate kinase n=1 Tax=Nocardioides eburneus TaxID=3231482 RepID=A0ABV3SV48_9ACTN
MSSAPQHSPTPRELDDLELIVHGVLPGPFNAPGSALTLTLPPEVEEKARAAGAVEIVDPEGLPLATVSWPAGEVTPLATPAYGPFRRFHLSPARVREAYAGRTFVPVTDALTYTELDEIAELGPVVLLALVGSGTPALSPVALLRATLLATGHLQDAVVVAVPLASHGDPEADHALGIEVTKAYAAGDPVHALSDAAESAEDPEQAADYPSDIAEVVEFDRPEPAEQGLVLFFTGLSGSGKSTLARALTDRILEQGRRTVTSLDGDVVRRNLSAGLTFSKEDRETNIRRIGWVAAEISRHGGVAVCSPIAPFDATRQDVRRYVDEAGGAFFLIHVATPLEECERRDRKGLYAKARAGEIPEFTGISSPYEEPADADVRVDTTGRTIESALVDILVALRDAGYLDLTGEGPGTSGAGEPAPFVPAPATEPAPTPEPLKVLFVCTANICRSAYAELVARSLVGDGDEVSFASAGTHGWRDHPLEAEMAAVLPEGVVADAFRSRPVTAAMLAEADLVLTMEAAQRAYLLQDHPEHVRKIVTLGQAAEALPRLAREADGPLGRAELLRRLGTSRGAADPALDVTDPYRKGPDAAAAAAERIRVLLDGVLAALRTP